MYKVLIVDDNVIIRKSIIARVSWQDMDMEVIGEASNGKEAYDLICKNDIDIVITDIKMPEINGLTLIEKTRTKYPHLQYIIISSFDDFKYTKKAILYKVVTYILKPVNNQELLNALNTSIQNITLLREQTKQKITMKRTRELHDFNHISNTVVGFLNNDKSVNQLSIEDLLKMDSYNDFGIITMNTISSRLSNKDLYTLYKAINNKGYDVTFVQITSRIFIIILTAHVIDTLLIDNLTHVIKKQLGKMDIENIYVSCSSIAHSIDNIRASYKESLNTQYCRFLDVSPKNGVYYYRKIDSDLLFDDELNNYKLALGLSARKQALETIDAIFMILEKETVNAFVLKFILRSIINSINNTLISNNLDKSLLPDKVFDRFYFLGFSTLDEIKDLFKDLTKKICASIKRNNQDGHERIIDYIKSNYNKSITIHLLAEKFYMNTNYLGQLIKKQTGQTFNQFINVLRIEQAKKILEKQPDIKLNDLAHSIGYADSQYFSKVFRKICGCTPTQYKTK